MGSSSADDWFALDLGRAREVSMAKIYLYTDGKSFGLPDSLSIEYQNGEKWMQVNVKRKPVNLTGNTVNTVAFDKVVASRIRINIKHK
jgi:hypothetical protein